MHLISLLVIHSKIFWFYLIRLPNTIDIHIQQDTQIWAKRGRRIIGKCGASRAFSKRKERLVVAPTPARIRVRADGSARLTLGNKKKRERSEERNVKKKRSFAARKWERKVSKNGARLRCGVERRGDRRVAGDFARFPSTYGRRSPDRCPPTPSFNLSPHFPPLKSPLVVLPLLLLLPSSHPFCQRVDVNSRVQILARSKFRTGN